MRGGIRPTFISSFVIAAICFFACAAKSAESTQNNPQPQASAPIVSISEPPITDSPVSPSTAVKEDLRSDLVPWNSNSPIGVVQSYEEEIRTIIKKYDNRKSAKATAERDLLLGKQVRRYFDFEELARLTLNSHWAGLKPSQRQRFTDTFVRLIERSYLNKTREMIAEYRVVYDDQQIKGSKAKVNSTIKKEDVDVKVTYEMKRSNSQTAKNSLWVIYNVVFDNLDLLGNYKSQFNRIITQKSFDELMRVMEEKLRKPAETVTL